MERRTISILLMILMQAKIKGYRKNIREINGKTKTCPQELFPVLKKKTEHLIKSCLTGKGDRLSI